MHSLETIERLNAEAVDRTRPARALGKWIVNTFCGLNLASSASYDTETEARAAVAEGETAAAPGERFVLLAPLIAETL